MRVIKIPNDDVDAVERIDEALAAGEPFAEIAARESSYNRSEASLEEVPLKGSLEEARLWGVDELNMPSRALAEGEHTERIAFGSSYWWVKLEEIRRPKQRSFYAVQHEIERELRKEEEAIELERYFGRLLQSANMTDRQEMERRLVRYAIEQFHPNPDRFPDEL